MWDGPEHLLDAYESSSSHNNAITGMVMKKENPTLTQGCERESSVGLSVLSSDHTLCLVPYHGLSSTPGWWFPLMYLP